MSRPTMAAIMLWMVKSALGPVGDERAVAQDDDRVGQSQHVAAGCARCR